MAGLVVKLLPTSIDGAHVISLERRGDERGFFARTFDAAIFEQNGMASAVTQCNMSFSAQRGTLRGMHYQRAPHQEGKLIRCVRGAIFDAIIDIRPESSTYRQWFGVELTAENREALFAPPGTAHGFITLTDDTEVMYQASASYAPDAEAGIRWNDPAFGIQWPVEPTVLSDKDRSWPDFPQGAPNAD